MNTIREIKRVLSIQAESLKEAKRWIGYDFKKAVEIIDKCKGKLVVTGIGKSGLVAQKIASTLASTGTPSIFLHPTEGMHGNLGIVHKNDVVFAIGKSGESEEILNILPSIKKIGAKIICLTANKDSSLARQSSLVLFVPIQREACPLNLAPTASSTVAMVIGDAIAIALMKKRGTDADTFALYHPGGLLGKRLLYRVADVMRGGSRNPVVKISDSINRLLVEISQKWTGAASVVNQHGKFVGLVTDFDIRRAFSEGKTISQLKIKDIMNSSPTVIYDDQMAIDALKIMESRKKPFTVLPVLNRRRQSIGMLHLHDLVTKGLTQLPVK